MGVYSRVLLSLCLGVWCNTPFANAQDGPEAGCVDFSTSVCTQFVSCFDGPQYTIDECVAYSTFCPSAKGPDFFAACLEKVQAIPCDKMANTVRFDLVFIPECWRAFFGDAPVTAKDVRGWSKGPDYEHRMKSILLGKHSEEAKVEAIAVLIEHNRTVNLAPITRELPTTERDALLTKLLPRIEHMSQSDDEGIRLLAKDGAYWLLKLEPKVGDDVSARLKAIMLNWIDDPDAFWSRTEKVGSVERKQIFGELGAKGLPVIERQMKARLAQLKDPQQLDGLGQDINEVLQLARSLNLPETDDLIAALMVEQMETLYPNIPIVLAKAFQQNKSEKLLPMARKIAIDNTHTHTELLVIKEFIIREFYHYVQPIEGIKVCREVVQSSTEGYFRWDCARTLVINAREKGVEHLFEDLPDDPVKLAIPSDHVFVGGLDLDPLNFHWQEIRDFCKWAQNSDESPIHGHFPLALPRALLASSDLMDQVVGLHCLLAVGEQQDIHFMHALAGRATPFEGDGWNFPERTLGELAARIAQELEDR